MDQSSRARLPVRAGGTPRHTIRQQRDLELLGPSGKLVPQVDVRNLRVGRGLERVATHAGELERTPCRGDGHCSVDSALPGAAR